MPQGLRVADVFPDTPAKDAGSRIGDLIVAVDGKSIAGLASPGLDRARIKGPPGTAVELTIRSPTAASAARSRVERADVSVPAVDGRIEHVGGDKVAYVRFRTFSEGAHGELRDEIETALPPRRRGPRPRPPRQRRRAAERGRARRRASSSSTGTSSRPAAAPSGEQDYSAVGDAIEPRPTVVLVNRDTASAAEILTAALKENDLATVVGTRTYGKGTFQQVLHLPAGGALDLTEGEYLTADGSSILGTGVKPQVRVSDDPKTQGDDEALDKALDVLRSQL